MTQEEGKNPEKSCLHLESERQMANHDALIEAGEIFSRAMNEELDRVRAKFDALSQDDRLDAFCAVVDLLYRGEMLERCSYRGLLYDLCGFGPESYMAAQNVGLIELHNAIYTRDELAELIARAMKELVGRHGGRVPTDEAIKTFLRAGSR